MKIKESNVTVLVKDMDKSVAFYQTIGLNLKDRWENHYAQLATRDIIIGLHPTTQEIPSNAKVSVGFMIENIEEARTLLDQNHIDYERADGKSGSYLHFHDPDGTNLYSSQPTWR
jgi:catechol 2,3-dioxygenase-like lactoylglutathione lyase family enzyme